MLIATIPGAFLGGLGLGGTLISGQAEPFNWSLAAIAAFVVAALGARWAAPGRWRSMGIMSLVGLCGSVIIFCAMAGGNGLPSLDARASEQVRSGLGVLSGPDLFWNGKAPAIDRLERDWDVRPLDEASQAKIAGLSYLLLVQPRALPPEDMVALDAWLRRGGRMVVLADPLLLWPDGPRLGDRRRAPLSNQLGALLAHWGIKLQPISLRTGATVERRFLGGGALLPVMAASRFERVSGEKDARCTLVEDRLMAACQIGRGQVRLVADADLIDDRLWLSDPDDEGSLSALSGDTMGLIDRWLRAPLDRDMRSPDGINWVRDDHALLAGVRWALLVGIGWAILGAMMISRWEKAGNFG